MMWLMNLGFAASGAAAVATDCDPVLGAVVMNVIEPVIEDVQC